MTSAIFFFAIGFGPSNSRREIAARLSHDRRFLFRSWAGESDQPSVGSVVIVVRVIGTRPIGMGGTLRRGQHELRRGGREIPHCGVRVILRSLLDMLHGAHNLSRKIERTAARILYRLDSQERTLEASDLDREPHRVLDGARTAPAELLDVNLIALSRDHSESEGADSGAGIEKAFDRPRHRGENLAAHIFFRGYGAANFAVRGRAHESRDHILRFLVLAQNCTPAFLAATQAIRAVIAATSRQVLTARAE
jgi:hypothetical protein